MFLQATEFIDLMSLFCNAILYSNMHYLFREIEKKKVVRTIFLFSIFSFLLALSYKTEFSSFLRALANFRDFSHCSSLRI